MPQPVRWVPSGVRERHLGVRWGTARPGLIPQRVEQGVRLRGDGRMRAARQLEECVPQLPRLPSELSFQDTGSDECVQNDGRPFKTTKGSLGVQGLHQLMAFGFLRREGDRLDRRSLPNSLVSVGQPRPVRPLAEVSEKRLSLFPFEPLVLIRDLARGPRDRNVGGLWWAYLGGTCPNLTPARLGDGGPR